MIPLYSVGQQILLAVLLVLLICCLIGAIFPELFSRKRK